MDALPNLDVYEHIRANDLKQAAVVMATFVYQTAQRDEMLPRKPIRPDDPRPEQTNPIQR